MSENKAPVTVIGLGPMGQAMVRVLLSDGHPVTVWNRTASRADEVVSKGAVRAETAAEALTASQLVLLSLTDYQAMYDILGGIADSLAGRVIVNLSSDTPERTREAARWAAERGATFITGGIMVPAELVGGEGSYVFYSGPREEFDAHQATLALLGRTDYVGTDPGLAQLYYQAQLDIFLTSLSAYLHATALLASAGVPARDFFPWAKEMFTAMPYFVTGTAEAIDNAEHPGELANVVMMGATADHIVGASKAAGIDLELPSAVKSYYDRAIAAGYGKSSWTSLYEVIGRR